MKKRKDISLCVDIVFFVHPLGREKGKRQCRGGKEKRKAENTHTRHTTPCHSHTTALGGPYRSRSNVSVWLLPVPGSRVTPTNASAWW